MTLEAIRLSSNNNNNNNKHPTRKVILRSLGTYMTNQDATQSADQFLSTAKKIYVGIDDPEAVYDPTTVSDPLLFYFMDYNQYLKRMLRNKYAVRGNIIKNKSAQDILKDVLRHYFGDISVEYYGQILLDHPDDPTTIISDIVKKSLAALMDKATQKKAYEDFISSYY